MTIERVSPLFAEALADDTSNCAYVRELSVEEERMSHRIVSVSLGATEVLFRPSLGRRARGGGGGGYIVVAVIVIVIVIVIVAAVSVTTPTRHGFQWLFGSVRNYEPVPNVS